MSSLAAQLAQSVSLNAGRLVDRSKRKPEASYLLTGRDADQLDLSAAHALGHSAFLHLVSTDPSFAKFEDTLFSDHAKETDRTLLTKEQNEVLDSALQSFLLRLGPYLLDTPTGRIIEWLVRRFRVHEFNVESLLAVFLPYHESPHFTKLISILKLDSTSAWKFLLPYKSAAQKLHRVSLVTEMLRNSEAARFIISLVPLAIKQHALHQVLITFNAVTLHDFIQRARSLDEATLAHLLPALLEPLQQKPKYTSSDSILATYVLISTLSQKSPFTPQALKIVIESMVSCSSFVRADQLIRSLVAVCQTQQKIDPLPSATIERLLQVDQLSESLCAALGWSGGQKVVLAVVQGLSKRLSDGAALTVTHSVITSPFAGPPLVENILRVLIPIALHVETSQAYQLVIRKLIGVMQQRHPSTVYTTFDEAAKADPSIKDAVEQLRIGLSMEQSGGMTPDAAGANMILGSSSADPKLRAHTVKELIKLASGGHLPFKELASVRTSLLARLQDDQMDVLEALYQDSPTVADLFSSDISSLVSALELALGSATAKPKRNILRLHFNFIASHLWSKIDASTKDVVFHNVVFPYLLFSKSRQKSAELVWSLVTDRLEKSSTATLDIWTANCGALTSPNIAEGSDIVEALCNINFQIAQTIAANIATLSDSNRDSAVSTLITKMLDENVHTRSLGYLITVALLQLLPAIDATRVAYSIMSCLAINGIAGVPDVLEATGVAVLDQLPHGKLVVTKTQSPSTFRWLQVALIVTVSRITRPKPFNVNWFVQTEIEQYVNVMRSLYHIANISSTVPVLASVVLQSMFLNLRDEALAFLGGVWSASSATNEVKRLSLLHGASFLEAHILERDGLDFQTILPSLLVALSSSDAPVVQAALECISRIHIIAQNKLSSVYRFDTIYGESGAALQYLDQADLTHYLSSLLERRDHLVHDKGYLKILHAEILNTSQGDKKKDTEFKHRIACFLLSHVGSLPSRQAQLSLLDSLALVNERGRIVILLPVISAVLDPAHASRNEPLFWTFVDLLLQSFDATSANHLNQFEDAWSVFLRVLCTCLKPDVPQSVKTTLKEHIGHSLFASLSNKRKQALCEVLIDLGTVEVSEFECRVILSTVLKEATLMVHLLQWSSPQAPTQSPRTAKRVRTTGTESSDDIARLTLLAEVLGTRPLPASLSLVTRLLDTLNQIVQSLPPTHPNINYIEQLLMSAIESSASGLEDTPNVSPSVIRLDVLAEIIRVSNNPQTFHQALLLMANLTRLAPESVLYNIMPVFTFMGSNVFHRDDTYSFKVVQETINGIVPTMAASLRKSHSEALQLNIASREFLRVFTDAANHIPRHRRNNFFIHLTEVLGARDFLPPICMLLVEKLANKAVRQQSEELQTHLALPIAIFQQADLDVQKYTAVEILEEVGRFVNRMKDPGSTSPTFLEGINEGDHSASLPTLLRRRSQALVLFVGHALTTRPRSPSTSTEGRCSTSTIMAHLIELAELSEPHSKDLGLENLAEAANTTMCSILKTTNVTEFIESIESMLRSDNIKVQSGALGLISKQVSHITPKARQGISASINAIFGLIKGILSIHKRGPIVTLVLDSIKGLSETLCPGEENSLSELVPSVIFSAQNTDSQRSALWALSTIPVKLGPRIIPFFRQIVSQSIAILRDGDSTLYEPALATLKSLLSTIPTFWGSGELVQLVYLYMDGSSVPGKAPHLNRLLKVTAKKVPAKSLLPALLETWASFKTSQDMSRFSAFFQILSLSLQHADRAAVMEYLRAVFSLFLDSFDIVFREDEAEHQAISAFKELVIKLNETAFKPLFRRLYDWAFVTDGANNSRKVTFGRLFSSLLDFFKGLMVPYTSFLLQPYGEILQLYKASELPGVDLWLSVIHTLTRSLSFDDGGFWRHDRLRELSGPLSAQISVPVLLGVSSCKLSLQECLAAFIENVNDDALLKSMNLAILMHARSEDANVRAYALLCIGMLWKSHSHKLLGFVSETATFISECSEDENDNVVKESFRLKNTIEAIVGKIDGF